MTSRHTDPGAASPIKLHTVMAVCTMTGLCRKTIYALLAAQELDHVKFGRRTLIPDDALRSLIASRRRTGRPASHGASRAPEEQATAA